MANEATTWLASVSEHCRKLIEIAGIAIRDRNEYEQDANKEALQAALNAHKEALQGLLPDDFPKSRIGDLARHIGGLSGFPCVGGRLNITPPWP